MKRFRTSRLWLRLVVLIAGLWLLAGAIVPATAQPRLRDPDEALIAQIRAQARSAGVQPARAVRDHFRVIGHTDLGGFADFGDVWAQGRWAYVGSRCGADNNGGSGVRVVDISDPSNPHQVSVLSNPRYTRAEDVVVRRVHTPFFSGMLAAAGIQICFGGGHDSAPTGFRLFDVTDPAHPHPVGNWILPRGDIGCHELDMMQRPGGKVLVGCAHNLVDQVYIGTPATEFVDVTDPSTPHTVSTFTLPVNGSSGVGCLRFKFAHSLRFEADGRQAYVSYWDAGTVRLGLRDPSNPVELRRTKIAPPDEDGDNHSMTLADNGRWMIINPEDFSPSDCPGQSAFGGWGEAYVYRQFGGHTKLLGTFSTPDSRSTRTDGAFTVHNTEVVGRRQMFSSWYSDGIVWWTMNNSGVSRQLGQFIPPPTQFAPPLVWGVAPDSAKNVILASDITSGLWLVRPVGLGHI